MPENTKFELSSDREVRISKFIHAPRELVFKAFSEADHVLRWWGPRWLSNNIERYEFRPGGTWRIVHQDATGLSYAFHGEFKEISAPSRIVRSFVYEGEPGHDLTETVELQEKDGGTFVIIRSQYANKADRDAMVNNGMEGGVRDSMERLEEELAKMRAGKEFVTSRTFNAPRELVFKVWTEKEHLAKWFGPAGSSIGHCELELKAGGSFHFSMKGPGGQESWGKWVFREVSAPLRIVLISSFSDPQGGFSRHPMSPNWPLETLSTTTFADENGKTKLTLSWVPFNASDTEIATFQAAFKDMNAGWSGTFAQMEDYLATLQ
jgi:uncharacterized protein YndB with AHSA1/START domain